jgi:hypothetical protein
LLVERSNEVHSLNAELIDAEDYGNTNLKFLEEERQSILSILCTNDSTRLAAVELAYEEDQQFVAVSIVDFIASSILRYDVSELNGFRCLITESLVPHVPPFDR